MKYLAPWRWGRITPEQSEHEEYPLATFQRAMNNLFEDFFHGVNFSPFEGKISSFNPKVDMVEDEKEIKVTAELPGIDEKNIEINLSKDVLTIKGEKSEEREEKGKEQYYNERSFGSFQRMIAIPAEVDQEKIDATFKKGVLTITLPKMARAQEAAKKIEIKSI